MNRRRVTDAEIERAVKLVKALGLEPGAVEVEPGKVRILAGDRRLTLPDDQAELDRELEELAAEHGYGRA